MAAKGYTLTLSFIQFWRIILPMGLKKTGIWLVLTVLGMMGIRADGSDYSIINLGTLGGTASVANAINQRGEVVGWAQDAAGLKQAFVWRDGTMSGLGFLGPYTASMANAINNHGVITGVASNSPTNHLAFVYDNNVMTSIGTLGGSASAGQGINDRMEIIGWSQASNNVPDASDPQTFFWISNQMHRIRSFHFYSSCEGKGVNQSGTVVGVTAAWTPNLLWWGYVWNDSNGNHTYEFGEMKLLGTFGGYYSHANAINDLNQVVGAAQSTQFIYRAFLVTQTGGMWKHPPPEELIFTNALMQDLGSLGGPEAYSEAFSINNKGIVVGTSASTNGLHAFIWRYGVMTDLNDLLPANSGWTLQRATGINDREEIVGFGTYEGQTRAFMMHRPSQITDFFISNLFTQTVLSNEVDGVYTQQNSQMESMEMLWSSIWSDPPTSHTFVLEFQQPDIAPTWYTAEVVGSDTTLSISTNHPLVLTNHLLWFRMKAVW